MQADTEHEQDDANLQQLAGEFCVRHHAGGGGSQQHTGKQIADQWRQFQFLRANSRDQCEHESVDKNGNQRRAVRHVVPGWRRRFDTQNKTRRDVYDNRHRVRKMTSSQRQSLPSPARGP